MTLPDALACLHAAGYVVESQCRSSDDNSERITLTNGAIVLVSNKDTCWVQGQNVAPVRAALAAYSLKKSAANDASPYW